VNKKSFSIKIFAGITCILLAISLLVFGILRIFMPKLYEEETNAEITKNSETFVIELETAPKTNWANMLMRFCIINNINATIFDENEQQVAIFKTSVSKTTYDDRTIYGAKDGNIYYSFTFGDDDGPYTMVFYFNNEPIEKVENTFETMFPVLFVVILIISLLIAFFYTRFVVNIKNLQTANQKLQADIEEERHRRDFFSAISHELKTPVTILKGELDGMILNVGKFKDRDKYLQKAYETTRSIEELVREIMTAAKLDIVELMPEEIDLSELTNECIMKIIELINEKNIKIMQDFSETPVFADKKLMGIVMSNIIGNAVKHSHQGAAVDLCLNENSEFSVVNHGVHIDKKSLESDLSGGLGLYIVKSILDLHEFKYRFENTPDGTVFTIIFTKM
jgi:two-component system sensor histidine kinase VanS